MGGIRTFIGEGPIRGRVIVWGQGGGGLWSSLIIWHNIPDIWLYTSWVLGDLII